MSNENNCAEIIKEFEKWVEQFKLSPSSPEYYYAEEVWKAAAKFYREEHK